MITGRSSFGLAIIAFTLSAGCNEGGGPGEQPDYALLLSPPALTVAQGANPTVAVSIDRTNFTGGVALFLTGAPASVTGTFVPGTTNGSNSTLTVAVGGGVTPGSYSLVVNGNGAPGARTTALPLTITAAPNYTMELTPATLTIARGASDSTEVGLTRTNFNGPVTLSLGGVVPANVTSAFVPAAPTTSRSVLTIIVGAGAIPGTYTLSVDANATVGDRSAGLTLIVQ